MEYKEKYEMALERARVWKDKSGMPKNKQGILDDIFPELAESEDEKIRKELITFFQRFPYTNLYDVGLNAKDVLAWLEKQGEQKPAWSEEDEKMLEKIDTDLYLYEGKVRYGRDKDGADTIKKHREWFKIFKMQGKASKL